MIKNIRACNGTGVAQCVILAILLVLLSSMLFFVGLSTDTNIAFADNGIVNDNLLKYNSYDLLNMDIVTWSTSGTNLQDGVITNSRTSGNAQVVILVDFPSAENFTITAYISGLSSGAVGRIGLANFSNNSVSNYNYYNFSSNGLVSYTHSANNYNCIVLNNNTISSNFKFEWIKVEVGSTFTGYVPKNYQNYGYDQGVIDFDYPIFQYVDVTTLNGGVGVNLDSSYMATNIVDQNASILRVYSVNNAQASYSPYVPCAFYYDFTNTIVTGSVILFDFNFNVQFNGTQRVYYKFAPLNTSLSSEDVNSYPDGYFDNNSTGVRLMCPIESTRIYFCVRVNQTSSFSGAGGLTYNYLYSCTRQIGDTIFSSVLPLDTDYINNAYNRGYLNGKADGIVIGQNEQPYSFKGLFSAIYSVPINAFNNMFNFDVFGVNMRTFILGMITFALALFVWKIIVRGG